jgi:hypothetical protein
MYKINELLREQNKLFHTQDLALLWGISNRNTLYTQIKRYVQKKILHPIHKGFYASVAPKKIDPILLGLGYLHEYAYLSTESMLVRHGVIFQHSEFITLLSSRSKKFTIGTNQFLVRQLQPQFLHNSLGVVNKRGYCEATLERAVADLLYFSPRYAFDNPKINWQEVKKIQRGVYQQ